MSRWLACVACVLAILAVHTRSANAACSPSGNPAGKYCNMASGQVEPCPAGNYCVSGVPPIACSPSTYCPPGSQTPAGSPCPVSSICTKQASIPYNVSYTGPTGTQGETVRSGDSAVLKLALDTSSFQGLTTAPDAFSLEWFSGLCTPASSSDSNNMVCSMNVLVSPSSIQNASFAPSLVYSDVAGRVYAAPLRIPLTVKPLSFRIVSGTPQYMQLSYMNYTGSDGRSSPAVQVGDAIVVNLGLLTGDINRGWSSGFTLRVDSSDAYPFPRICTSILYGDPDPSRSIGGCSLAIVVTPAMMVSRSVVSTFAYYSVRSGNVLLTLSMDLSVTTFPPASISMAVAASPAFLSMGNRARFTVTNSGSSRSSLVNISFVQPTCVSPATCITDVTSPCIFANGETFIDAGITANCTAFVAVQSSQTVFPVYTVYARAYTSSGVLITSSGSKLPSAHGFAALSYTNAQSVMPSTVRTGDSLTFKLVAGLSPDFNTSTGLLSPSSAFSIQSRFGSCSSSSFTSTSNTVCTLVAPAPNALVSSDYLRQSTFAYTVSSTMYTHQAASSADATKLSYALNPPTIGCAPFVYYGLDGTLRPVVEYGDNIVLKLYVECGEDYDDVDSNGNVTPRLCRYIALTADGTNSQGSCTPSVTTQHRPYPLAYGMCNNTATVTKDMITSRTATGKFQSFTTSYSSQNTPWTMDLAVTTALPASLSVTPPATPVYSVSGGVVQFSLTNSGPSRANLYSVGVTVLAPCTLSGLCPPTNATCITGLRVAEISTVVCTATWPTGAPGNASYRIDAYFYSNTGQNLFATATFNATTCPAGYYCPAGSTSPIVCTSTGYCPAGSASPITCPGGSYCPTGSASPTACPVRSYCVAGSSSPSQCSSGTYCPAGSSSPVSCSSGYYCPAGSGTQTPCPAGSYCPSTQQVPVTCSAGFYCPAMSNTQIPCMSGTYCPAGSSAETPCPAGSYCPVASASPTPCTAGTYCPPRSGARTTCSGGNYCPAGSGNQTVCPAGSYCPAASSTPTVCTAGNYCPAGSAAPVPCPPGTVSNSTAQASCYSCPNGTLANSSQTACETVVSCPAGYYCTTAGSTPIACLGGFYCPAGSQSPTACPSNQYCPAGSVSPIACPPNQYCPAGSSQGIDAFTFSIANESALYYATDQGEIGENNVLKVVFRNAYSQTARIAADGGVFLDDRFVAGFLPALSPVDPLSSRVYQFPGASSVFRPSLYEFRVTVNYDDGVTFRVSSYFDWKACVTGNYCPNQFQMLPCPAGYYCPAVQSSPIECKTGTFSTASQSACANCTAGTVANSTAQTSCYTCPSGTNANAARSACEATPVVSAAQSSSSTGSNIFHSSSSSSSSSGVSSSSSSTRDSSSGVGSSSGVSISSTGSSSSSTGSVALQSLPQVNATVVDFRVINMDTGNAARPGETSNGYLAYYTLQNTGSLPVTDLDAAIHDFGGQQVYSLRGPLSLLPGAAIQIGVTAELVPSVAFHLHVYLYCSSVPSERAVLAADWPTTTAVGASASPSSNVQVSVVYPVLPYGDTVTASSQICSEVQAATQQSQNASGCVVLSIYPTSAVLQMKFDAALVLQQFLSASAASGLSPTTFPIFSTSTQLSLYYPEGTIDPALPTLPTFDINCTLSSCGVQDQCTVGLCSCQTNPSTGYCLDNPTCAGGAPSHFADVCENPLSTRDNLVYEFVECFARYPTFVNICPNRRYCQALDQSVKTDRFVFTGMLGRPGITNPVLFFTIQSPYTLQQLLNTKRNATTGVVSFEAYVSNLYDNQSPRNNKVWSHIEFTTFYANSTAQLTKLRFLDSVEGAPEYYFANNHWNAAVDIPSFSCARWDGTQQQWDCQAYRVYNSITNQCEQGCNNGLLGTTCSLQDPSIGVMEFNASTTLYRSYSGDSVVCLPGYLPGFSGCVPLSQTLPPISRFTGGDETLASSSTGGTPLSDTSLLEEVSDARLAGDLAAVAGLVVGGAVLVGMATAAVVALTGAAASSSASAVASLAFVGVTAGKPRNHHPVFSRRSQVRSSSVSASSRRSSSVKPRDVEVEMESDPVSVQVERIASAASSRKKGHRHSSSPSSSRTRTRSRG